MDHGENISNHGWSEYGRLVLNELQRLNEGQESMKRDIDTKFNELNLKISSFNSLQKDVDELNDWKKRVIEVWSVSQMKQSKDEIYKQKGYYQKVIGILIAIQVLASLIIAFKDNLF